jgi:hypothetical protein
VKTAFLTIDWDFFIPEKLEWRFHQEEKRLYLSTAWKRRYKYINEVKTNGEETSFWNKLNLDKTLPYYVSDSHLAAYSLKELHSTDTVVIIDAHHDIFKIDEEGPDCGTWLTFWLKKSKARKVYWVKPAHSICVPPTSGFEDQIVTLQKAEDLPVFKYNATHVCRSGCWTPPWTDNAFIRFVKEYRETYKVIDEKWTNPMRERWTLADYEEARVIQEQNTDYFRHLAKTPVPMEYVVKFKEEGYKFL